jgi:hypothetical protein
MMSKLHWSHANATNKYVAEYKSEAVKQVIDQGHAVVDVASGWEFRKEFCTAGSTSSRSQRRLNQVI